ncbi:MAG: TldD/PmbA family protein [Deltaproteobacteria bacterium]|nr:TldD/PmbA family protein [Deltaproteobacteria bacterium]
MTPEKVLECVKDRLAGKGKGFELYLQSSRQTGIEAKGGEVTSFQKAEPKGAALRIFSNRKVGFAMASSWDRSALEKMVRYACEGLPFLSEEPWVIHPLLATPTCSEELPVFEGCDSSLATLPEKKRMALAVELEKRVLAKDPRIRRIRKAEYQEEVAEITLFSSAKKRGLHYQKSLCEISLQVVAEAQEDQQAAWSTDFSTHFDKLDPDRLASDTAERALSLLGARPVATQKTQALLDPLVVTSLLSMLVQSFLAENVQKKKSPWVGKKGQEIYSKVVTLIDDGGLQGGYRSSPFDGEGVARRRTVVVEKGVLNHFLYDSASACRDGLNSTGNAFRGSFKDLPVLSHSNFFVSPGRRPLEAMIRSLYKGFWVRDIIGAHTIDPFSGDFSVGATGFWIEKGEKAFPVRGVAIAGNLHEIFKKSVEVGADLRFYESIGSPTLWVEELQVAGN